jgi:hypothetical protein
MDRFSLLFIFHVLRFNASDFAVRAPAVRVPVALAQLPGSVAGSLDHSDRSGTSGRFSDLSPVAFSFPPMRLIREEAFPLLGYFAFFGSGFGMFEVRLGGFVLSTVRFFSDGFFAISHHLLSSH